MSRNDMDQGGFYSINIFCNKLHRIQFHCWMIHQEAMMTVSFSVLVFFDGLIAAGSIVRDRSWARPS